ncbi:hypothetical protein Tco_0281444 [Tanacetum coccineum]
MVVTTSHDLPIITHNVAPYEPPVPSLGHLAHHAEEALMNRTMESLRKIRVNLPFIKEIRKTDDYAKHMKNLVINKPRTSKEGDVKLNAGCLAVLQNQLPPKEKDTGSFILPCSIGNLTVRNALVDLGASVSIMPLSIFKRLGLGKLKPVNMIVEMTDRTKSIPKGIVEILLVKIDKFLFLVDFVILDMVEDFRMPIILGRPLLATAHAEIDVFRKLISLEVGNEKVGNEKVVFKIEDKFNKTLTPIELVCDIRNVENVLEDDLLKLDHDLFLYNSTSCIKTNKFSHLLSIDADIFTYEVFMQESREEIDYRCSMLDQGEPWEIEAVEEPNRNKSMVKPKEHWCMAILQQKGDGHELWASSDHYDDQCNRGDVPDHDEMKCYWICMNDDKRLDVAWEGMSFKDWVRVSHGKVDKMTEERILKDYWRQELNNDSDYENDGNSINNAAEMRFTQEENSYDKMDFGEDL